MRAALLLLLLSGCSVPYFVPDESILGVEFDWRTQADRDAGPVLAACSDIVGARNLQGARVRFVADNAAVAHDCQPAPPERGTIAGCWSTQLNDLVVLTPAPLLADTALCHELAHRARHYAHGQVFGADDPHHCDRALWDAIGVQATGVCR